MQEKEELVGEGTGGMIEEDCENPGEDKGKFIFCHQFGISEPDIVVLYNDPDECKRYLEVE